MVRVKSKHESHVKNPATQKKRFKPRKVDLETRRLENGRFIYAGDSLRTVACPNCISKGMRQNLRKVAFRLASIFPYRSKSARGLMKELKITIRRKGDATL